MKSKKPHFAAKILALVLSLLMLLGAMPVAFAAEGDIVIKWPTAEREVEYGQKYCDAGLVGGEATISGEFVYVSTTAKPSAIGEKSRDIQFVPTDTTVAPVLGTVVVNVVPSKSAVLTGNVPTTSPISVGQKLSDSIIDNTGVRLTNYGKTLNGLAKCTWKEPDKIMNVAGTFTEIVICAPEMSADLKKIAPIEVEIEVVVENAADAVRLEQLPTASDITFGQTLADSVLTGGVVTKGGNPLAGTFAWKDSSIAPAVGTAEYDVVFTPDDTTVEPMEMKVSVKTGRGIVEVTEWPEVTGPYMYGKRLYECVKLDEGGKASVPGRFTIINDELYQAKVPESINDTVEVNVTFYPDGFDYQNVTKKITVKFDKLEPDCYASVKIDDYSNSNVVTASVSGWVRNDSSWAQHTGKFYYTLDGVTTESDDGRFSAKYNYTNLAPGQHTFSCEYVAGENDVYVSGKSEEVTFEIIAAYTVTVTDCTGTYVKGDYRPGNSFAVSAAKHEKAYYEFSGWTAEGAEITTHTDFANEYVTITMPEGDIHLTANYKFNFKLFLEDSFTKAVVWLKDIVTQGIEWIKGLLP